MSAPTAAASLASIPSPAHGIFHVGPVPLHAYGLCIAVGILLAVRISERRWERRGHPRSDIGDIVIWIVIAGIVGARLYHVVTDYELYTHDPLKALFIWDGGLGIWGAVAGGAIAVLVLARRRHLDALALMDTLAPGVALAQAIGRWGNYFNQELFGRPTNLPWAIEIDRAHRPALYKSFATFQPTFLYESLWCLAIFVVLLAAERRFRLRRGQTVALYVVLYTAGRFVFENMRSDFAHTIGGLRINAWASLVIFALGLAWFVWLGKHGRTAEAEPRDASSDAQESSVGSRADQPLG